MNSTPKTKRGENRIFRNIAAFFAVTASLIAVLAPSYMIKTNTARSLYEDLAFTRVAVEARQYIRKIEYSIRNGKELEQYYHINTLLRGIQQCSSYVAGVYVVSGDDALLFELNSGFGNGYISLKRPHDLTFENSNDYKIVADSDYYELFLPVFGAYEQNSAYLIVRLGRGITNYAVLGLVAHEQRQSLIISLEFLAFGLIFIIRKKPKAQTAAILALLLAFSGLSVDFLVSRYRYASIADSAVSQTISRITQMLQSDVDTVKSVGVSPEFIYDQNSWLKKSVQGIPMVHSIGMDSDMRISIAASKEYIERYNKSLSTGYICVYALLFVLASVTASVFLRISRSRKKQRKEGWIVEY